MIHRPLPLPLQIRTRAEEPTAPSGAARQPVSPFGALEDLSGPARSIPVEEVFAPGLTLQADDAGRWRIRPVPFDELPPAEESLAALLGLLGQEPLQERWVSSASVELTDRGTARVEGVELRITEPARAALEARDRSVAKTKTKAKALPPGPRPEKRLLLGLREVGGAPVVCAVGGSSDEDRLARPIRELLASLAPALRGGRAELVWEEGLTLSVLFPDHREAPWGERFRAGFRLRVAEHRLDVEVSPLLATLSGDAMWEGGTTRLPAPDSLTSGSVEAFGQQVAAAAQDALSAAPGLLRRLDRNRPKREGRAKEVLAWLRSCQLSLCLRELSEAQRELFLAELERSLEALRRPSREDGLRAMARLATSGRWSYRLRLHLQRAAGRVLALA